MATTLVAAVVLMAALARESYCATVAPECSTTSVGQMSGVPHLLPPKYLLPYRKDITLDIPNECASPLSVVGVKATVCDPHSPPPPVGPPQVLLPTTHVVIVHRDRTTPAATLNIVLYCGVSEDGLKRETFDHSNVNRMGWLQGCSKCNQ